MTNPNAVTAEEWAVWQAGHPEPGGVSYDEQRRARAKRDQPRLIDALFEQTQDLELGKYVAEEALHAALELLVEAREQLAFERDVIAGLLLEIPPVERGLRVAA